MSPQKKFCTQVVELFVKKKEIFSEKKMNYDKEFFDLFLYHSKVCDERARTFWKNISQNEKLGIKESILGVIKEIGNILPPGVSISEIVKKSEDAESNDFICKLITSTLMCNDVRGMTHDPKTLENFIIKLSQNNSVRIKLLEKYPPSSLSTSENCQILRTFLLEDFDKQTSRKRKFTKAEDRNSINSPDTWTLEDKKLFIRGIVPEIVVGISDVKIPKMIEILNSKLETMSNDDAKKYFKETIVRPLMGQNLPTEIVKSYPLSSLIIAQGSFWTASNLLNTWKKIERKIDSIFRVCKRRNDIVGVESLNFRNGENREKLLSLIECMMDQFATRCSKKYVGGFNSVVQFLETGYCNCACGSELTMMVIEFLSKRLNFDIEEFKFLIFPDHVNIFDSISNSVYETTLEDAKWEPVGGDLLSDKNTRMTSNLADLTRVITQNNVLFVDYSRLKNYQKLMLIIKLVLLTLVPSSMVSAEKTEYGEV